MSVSEHTTTLLSLAEELEKRAEACRQEQLKPDITDAEDANLIQRRETYAVASNLIRERASSTSHTEGTNDG